MRLFSNPAIVRAQFSHALRYLLLSVVSLLILVFIGSSCFGKDSLEIDLGKIGTMTRGGGLKNINPLIEFHPPPKGSSDFYRLSRQGLEIKQSADTEGRPSWKATFRTTAMMKRDFRIRLDLECEVEEPKKGWGQGLLLSAALNDEDATELKIGRLAIPETGQICQGEVSGRHVEQPIYMPLAHELKSGSLVIERVGGNISFSIIDQGEEIIVAEIESSKADVRYVEVVCTRQRNGGDTEATYLLKKLHLETDEFFAFEQASPSRFRWWYVTLALVGVIVLRLIFAGKATAA